MYKELQGLERPPRERLRPHYQYPGNAVVRRHLHNFGERAGETGFDFYKNFLQGMDLGPDDIVVDVGAGTGLNEGLTIALNYQVSELYLLETPGGFETKFLQLEEILQQVGVRNVRTLMGVAENIPLDAGRITRLMSVHSVYEFPDLAKALSEFRRTMADDALGGLVSTGPGNKLRFRKFLAELGEELGVEAPDTRSSRLDYSAAALALEQNGFRVTKGNIYQDRMVIDEPRLPYYLWAIDTYRDLFAHRIINDGRWLKARKKIVEAPIEAEMAANGGVFLDTIDIGSIYFQKADGIF